MEFPIISADPSFTKTPCTLFEMLELLSVSEALQLMPLSPLSVTVLLGDREIVASGDAYAEVRDCDMVKRSFARAKEIPVPVAPALGRSR